MVQEHQFAKVFTFSREEEQRSGVLTMMVFSLCLIAAIIFILVINMIGTSLALSFFQEYSGAYAQEVWLDKLFPAVLILVMLFFALYIPYGGAGIAQLLTAYAVLDGDRLVKLRWSGRRTTLGVRSWLRMARQLGYFQNMDMGSRHNAAAGVSAFIGIGMMANRDFVAWAVDSREESCLFCTPMTNIQLHRKTKKYLLVEADMVIRGRHRRKKVKIYRMYQDMQQLELICEGGRLYVD